MPPALEACRNMRPGARPGRVPDTRFARRASTGSAPRFGLRSAALPVALFALALPSAARARDRFPGFVPNGAVHGCATCHVNPAGGGTRNSFGRDVEATRVDGLPDWSAVFDLDSDRDGQTNGQELGDPCGVWHPGSTPDRRTDISQPGNADSMATNPEECGAGGSGGAGGVGGTGAGGAGGTGGPDGGGGDDGDLEDELETGDDDGSGGGCTTAGGTGALGLLAGGWFLARRRR